MGRKKAKSARWGALAVFVAALKIVVVNMVLTTVSCAAVYALLTAARKLA